MPTIHVPMPETEQSVYRNVVLGVVKQVQDMTGMADVQIYFTNEDKKAATTGGTIDSTNDKFVETTSKKMNNIVVDEEIDKDEMSPTFFDGHQYTPIFEDRKLGVVMSPIYAKHQVTVTCNYQCQSKNEATRWLQNMRLKIGKLRDMLQHTVEYHYALDSRLMNLITIIHGLREAQGGYGETLEVYTKNHASPRLTVIADQAGQHRILAVAERQTEIYGQFEFDGLPPRPEKEGDAGVWVITFVYKFNYDKPIGLLLKYPVMVHNQMLPEKYLTFMTDEVRDIANGPIDGSRVQTALRMFRADMMMDAIKSEDGMLVMPKYDDFLSDVQLKYTIGAIQGLLEISSADKRSLLNLGDFGDYNLDADVLQFLRESEYPYLCRPYKSIFNLSLYQNKTLQDYSVLSVNSSLDVTATRDLDVRSQYRIRLGVVTDCGFLDPAAIVRLRNYPKVLHKVVCAINHAFRDNPEMAELGIKEFVSEIEFSAIYRVLLGMEPASNVGGSSNIGWGTAGALKAAGISPQLVQRISNEGRFQRRTMITGILAYRSDDPGLHETDATNVDVSIPASG